MLPTAAMVKARKAVESMYDGVCTITEYQEYVRQNKSTGHKEVDVLAGQPCRLSFSTITSTDPAGMASQVIQTVKVFMAPEVHVKPGSKLTITQNDVTTSYKSSGEAAIYETHQEIMLELFERWS